MKKYNTVLTIAGSDPSGGAGVQADIKAISAAGCYAASVITSLTAQNTVGVRGVHTPNVEFFISQLETVLDDIEFGAIKIGMLPSEDYVLAVVEAIDKYKLQNIVLDPVMVATSGDRLIDDMAASAIIKHLIPKCAIITPNISEAEFISGEKDFSKVADALKVLGAKNILLKGGHNPQKGQITDILFTDQDIVEFTYDFSPSKNTHGTGCTLSSSIAAFLAKGYALSDAVKEADDYLHKALNAGCDYELGHGHGAVNHFLL